MVRFASALTIASFLCFGAACDGESETPNTGETNKQSAGAPTQESPKTPKAEAPKAAPEIKAGMEAKQVVALMSHPDQDFGGMEGQGCFGYDDQPDKTYCFSLNTEQATWAQVFGENYLVSDVRARDPEETARAKPIKKPVLAQPDSKDDGH